MNVNRTLIAEVLADVEVDAEVTIGGWIRTVRASKGGFSFITLNDGSCMDCIQIVADKDLDNYDNEISHLTAGCSLLVTGKVVESPGKGQRVELHANQVRVIGLADAEKYPIQPKRHTFEFLRTQAHLRARTNTFGAVARVRSAMAGLIHDYFQSRGFLYVHTPVITASDCEGAGELFHVSTLDPDALPRDEAGAIDYSEDFFSRPTYLTVSGQLEAETYACALGDVYTFGPTFRAENSNTPRHLAEFWMIEPEMAFCDLQGDADLAEDFLKNIFTGILNKCPSDMEFFNKRIDKTVIETLTHIAESPFERITYTQAIELLEKTDCKWQFPVSWGIDLQTEHERYLTEETFKKPVIITDYPSSIKPFYMRLSDDGKTVAAMDVLVPKIGEIIGGAQREERIDVLTERMEAQSMNVDDYWWYCDLRKYGTVPHAGFGLGFERTIQFATGMANIRDVIPYPRTPRSAEF
ncbi:MAG: asparagine--tRNA ligase [Phycisphaerae bacterium]|jgi:asparaginyl-tRNA synthetase|nr:asparagine--tRNA ligase [Phycisphaerae bacterium]